MLISVIMPVFNGGSFVEKALNSVFMQNVPKESLEIIVINDGSTDQTKDILMKRAEEGLLIITQPNQGLVVSLNKGLKKARGKYVIRLDADDYFAPGLLAQSLDLLEKHNEYAFIYTDRFEVDENAGNICEFRVGENNIFDMIACGTLVRRSVFEEIGYYEDLLFEEYDFYFRLFQRFKGFYLQEPLYYYVKHGLNMTEQEGYWEKGVNEFLNKWGKENIIEWVNIQMREKGESKIRTLIGGEIN